MSNTEIEIKTHLCALLENLFDATNELKGDCNKDKINDLLMASAAQTMELAKIFGISEKEIAMIISLEKAVFGNE